MGKETISTSLNPDVIITEVSGDLHLKGWDKPEVSVIARQEDLFIEQHDDQIRLGCKGSCEVRLPQNASLQVQTVYGNAQLKFLDEPVKLGVIKGSLTMRNTAAAEVEEVHGDLSVWRLSGDFRAREVKGDAEIRTIQGDCRLEEVGGRLDGLGLEGEVNIRACGRIYLHISVIRGTDYQIHSESNVHCLLPEDASLKLDLSSQSELIKVRLDKEAITLHQGYYSSTINGGEASMTISSGGTIYLASQKPELEMDGSSGFEEISIFDFQDYSPEVAQQVGVHIRTRMEALTEQMGEEIDRISERIGKANLSPEATSRIVEQMRQDYDHATTRAQEKIRRAQEKLERKLEDARRRQERRAEEFDRRTRHGKRSWSFQWPAASTQTQPEEQEPVSEEERLMILRMLEGKKITLQEADKLLAALEGKEE